MKSPCRGCQPEGKVCTERQTCQRLKHFQNQHTDTNLSERVGLSVAKSNGSGRGAYVGAW